MRALMLLLVCLFNTAQAEEFSTKIIVVIDGDTVVIRRASGLLKIRLAEIDAPEKAQSFGSEATQSLVELVLHKQVTVVSRAVDKYGRMVASLSINGFDVNAEQVRRGMAWEYHSSKEMVALQTEAKNASRGLWSESNPMPPWEWRKLHPSTWPGDTSSNAASSNTPSSGTTSLGAASAGIPLSKKSHKTKTPLNPACGKKRRCSQMTSCEEAKFYLNVCKIKSLDRKHDGVPCKKLCGGKKKR